MNTSAQSDEDYKDQDQSSGVKDMQHNDQNTQDDSGVEDMDIQEAAKAVSGLTPGDFQPMSGIDVPVTAEDGEPVHYILIGTAKDGKLVDAKGAECVSGYDDSEEEGKPKGRISIMISGGKKPDEMSDEEK